MPDDPQGLRRTRRASTWHFSVAESTIAEALAADRTPQEISTRLVELAAASEDDVTALVARYHLPA